MRGNRSEAVKESTDKRSVCKSTCKSTCKTVLVYANLIFPQLLICRGGWGSISERTSSKGFVFKWFRCFVSLRSLRRRPCAVWPLPHFRKCENSGGACHGPGNAGPQEIDSRSTRPSRAACPHLPPRPLDSEFAFAHGPGSHALSNASSSTAVF